MVERSPGFERGDRVERGVERQRPAGFKSDVPHVGCVDRFQPLLAQRIVDRTRNQIVRDVVQDLVLKRCLMTRAGALPGRKPGTRALRE